MTVNQAVDLFKVLIDKYESAYLTDQEILDLLNMALRGEYMNRLFPDSQGGVVNWEQDQNVTENLKPLLFNLSLNMNASGILSNSTINAALVTASGESGATAFRIGSIGWTLGGSSYPVKYIKTNDRWANQRNVFKRPSSTNPKYSLISTGLQFYPTSELATLTVNVVKTPKLLVAGETCELSDYVMYHIISIGLKLAGVAIRDTEMQEDVRLAALQTMQ
jgi:hypothetical protein